MGERVKFLAVLVALAGCGDPAPKTIPDDCSVVMRHPLEVARTKYAGSPLTVVVSDPVCSIEVRGDTVTMVRKAADDRPTPESR